MAKTKKSMTHQGIFEKIVRNALDYLQVSIAEIDTRPKYSLINFYSAVELLLKARLLSEHWTLIVDSTNDKKVSLSALLNGDLATIQFDRACLRLENIVRQPLRPKERTCFDNLRRHRNKLIHFYNEHYSGKRKKLIEEVVVEQCKAWFYLYNLISEDWHPVFASYKGDFEKVHAKLEKNKKYLKGKYQAIEEKIQNKRLAGISIDNCPVCKYEASELREVCSPLYEYKCLVCSASFHVVIVRCQNNDCGADIIVEGDPHDIKCDSCGEEIDYDTYMSIVAADTDSNVDSHGDGTWCSDCWTAQPSVVELKNGTYLCLECLGTFSQTSVCDYCNAEYAGDIGEDTYLCGCQNCEGMLGNQRDD